ncbi:glucagon receptor isoform X2 [Otolemur garnettii]|uniref:glucagon receptor isoform X2 n=1 Tax=Otolemur garnettii TaxID=30611 RepID=UPI000C7F0EBC|nr:glucagon receptor isoform X2 [Otolemur garnettii]
MLHPGTSGTPGCLPAGPPPRLSLPLRSAALRSRRKVCARLGKRGRGRGAGADPDRQRSGSKRPDPNAPRGRREPSQSPDRHCVQPVEEDPHPRGPQCPRRAALARCGRQLPGSMSPTWPRHRHLLLLLLLLAYRLQATSAQVMDFLFEKWKLYSDQCYHNQSLLPPPTELVCNRTFDKYSCWPDTPPNTTANISCPWYLPWHHKVQHRFVFKRCGPDGQWVQGPRGQPWRNASQCQLDDEELEVQKEVVKMYSSFQGVYTVGYSLSLGALLLALATLLGLSKLHCTRNYVHANLFASFMLKACSVLVIDRLIKTRYSQKIGDDLSVSIWLSDGAVAGCRVASVFMQYGVVANYCWLLVEGVHLHSLLGRATLPERSRFTLYLGIGWGAPMLFVIPWAVVRCLFENIQCWTSNDNMGFWWILRFPVFLAILLQARQMHYTDYKFRLAKSTLTLIPLLGVHEVVFAFVTDEHAQGTLRSAKLFFDLFLSSFQGLLVAVLYCFLNKEVQSELRRYWRRWLLGKALRQELRTSSHVASTGPSHGIPCEKLQLVRGGSSNGAGQNPSAEPPLAGGLPGLAESPSVSLAGAGLRFPERASLDSPELDTLPRLEDPAVHLSHSVVVCGGSCPSPHLPCP